MAHNRAEVAEKKENFGLLVLFLCLFFVLETQECFDQVSVGRVTQKLIGYSFIGHVNSEHKYKTTT